MTAADWAQIVSAIGTAVAAVAAWRAADASSHAITATRDAADIALHDSKVTRTFDLIRLVEGASLSAWSIEPTAWEEAIESARPGGRRTTAALQVIGSLGAIEIYATAALKGTLVRSIADASFVATVGPTCGNLLDFIDDFREACGDPTAYEDILQYINLLELPPNRPDS